eukprot:COSAG01_NODE_1192_length_11309_cov_8.575609_14_plen_134_part_00
MTAAPSKAALAGTAAEALHRYLRRLAVAVGARHGLCGHQGKDVGRQVGRAEPTPVLPRCCPAAPYPTPCSDPGGTARDVTDDQVQELVLLAADTLRGRGGGEDGGGAAPPVPQALSQAVPIPHAEMQEAFHWA